MNFDDWQDLWQKQPVLAPANGAATEALIKRVRADARSFDRTLLWRDFREGIAALAVSGAFAWEASSCMTKGVASWHAWLAAALPLGVAGFLVIDRLRVRRTKPRGASTVISEVDHALAALRHQHWLLTRITWWYLLPLAASTLLITLHPIISAASPWPNRLAQGVFIAMVIGMVNYGIWRLNRRTVVKELAPRIEQLERERRDLCEPTAQLPNN